MKILFCILSTMLILPASLFATSSPLLQQKSEVQDAGNVNITIKTTGNLKKFGPPPSGYQKIEFIQTCGSTKKTTIFQGADLEKDKISFQKKSCVKNDSKWKDNLYTIRLYNNYAITDVSKVPLSKCSIGAIENPEIIVSRWPTSRATINWKDCS